MVKCFECRPHQNHFDKDISLNMTSSKFGQKKGVVLTYTKVVLRPKDFSCHFTIKCLTDCENFKKIFKTILEIPMYPWIFQRNKSSVK